MKLFITTGYTRFIDADTGEDADYVDIQPEDATIVLTPDKDMGERIVARLRLRGSGYPEMMDVCELEKMTNYYHIYIGKGFSEIEKQEIIKNLPETLRGKVKIKNKPS